MKRLKIFHSMPFRFQFMRMLPVVFLLAYGCGGSSKQISLRYNLDEGKVYRQRTITKQTIEQDFYGQKQTVVSTIESVTSYRLLSKSGDESELEVSYDTLELFISHPEQEMHFSSKGSFWQKDDLFSQVLNVMSGKSFKVKVNNTSGKISEVTGLEKLFENVLAQFQTASSEQLMSVMEVLNKSYGEGAFRNSFEATNSYFTSKPLKKGDSWENTITLTSVNAELVNNWKLTEVNGPEATISCSGELISETGSDEVDVEGVTTKLDLNGKQSATLKVDHKTGWTTSGEVTQDFEGKMQAYDPQSGERAEWPIRMKHTITYLTLDER